MSNKDKSFKSKLGAIIASLIEERVAKGLSRESYLNTFYDFDFFIVNNGFDDGTLSKALLEAWSIQRPTENTNTRNSRINAARLIAKYMNSLGLDAYFPMNQASTIHKTPYIPTRNELIQFFKVVDSHVSKTAWADGLQDAYPVMFRLYYCYGMRLNEAVCIKKEDVDLQAGTIYIRHSKGDKDRVIFLKEDMLKLMKAYDEAASMRLSVNREWFFPGKYGSNHYCKTGLCNLFVNLWKESFPDWTGKRPTIHSLRHAFVVHRINDWTAEGSDAEVLFPYISRFIGHESIQETMYYYHSKDTESMAWTRFTDDQSDLLEVEWL